MNIFCVYAHDDPTSFGAAMHNRSLSFFEKQGHAVSVSDLYALGFHAVAEKWDFKVSGGAHRNYMLEQQRVSAEADGSAFAEDIRTEIDKLRACDLLVLNFPLWWSAPPAILKGWLDKIFALGVVWDGDHRYEKGLLRGKQVLVVTGAGDSETAYAEQGMHGATIVQHLYPLLHSTLAHAGLDVLKPFIAHGLTSANDDERRILLENLEQYLSMWSTKPEYIYKHG